MAYFAQSSLQVADLPPRELLGDGAERLQSMREQVGRQHAHRERGDPFWPGHSGHSRVGLMSGFRYPTYDEPIRVKVTKLSGTLPDFLHVPRQFAFSITQEVRDLIEKFEPGVHQYLPFELHLPGGQKEPTSRWLLNICNRLDTISIESSRNIVEGFPNRELYPALSYYGASSGKREFAVFRDKIAGHALWSEYKYDGLIGLSHEFAEEIFRRKLRGWQFYYFTQLMQAREV